jgi:hypothetical protein
MRILQIRLRIRIPNTARNQGERTLSQKIRPIITDLTQRDPFQPLELGSFGRAEYFCLLIFFSTVGHYRMKKNLKRFGIKAIPTVLIFESKNCFM